MEYVEDDFTDALIECALKLASVTLTDDTHGTRLKKTETTRRMHNATNPVVSKYVANSALPMITIPSQLIWKTGCAM